MRFYKALGMRSRPILADKVSYAQLEKDREIFALDYLQVVTVKVTEDF